MITLDKAIKRCEEVADYDCYSDSQLDYAEMHRQLAEWLTELKKREDADNMWKILSRFIISGFKSRNALK